MQVCDAISDNKSSAYTMKVLVPLVSPLMVTTTMQPRTFAKYMAFMKAALKRCEERTAAAPQPSNGVSLPASVATWDEVHDASTATVARIQPEGPLSSTAGLGLGVGDSLSDWSSSLCAPSASPERPPHAGSTGLSMNGKSSVHQGLTAVSSPMQSHSSVQGVPMRIAQTAQDRSSTGMVHGSAMFTMQATQGKQQPSLLLPDAPHIPQGPSIGTGRSGPTQKGMTAQFSGMAVGGATNDPFADLLAAPVSSSAGTTQAEETQGRQLLNVPHLGKWDPFA